MAQRLYEQAYASGWRGHRMAERQIDEVMAAYGHQSVLSGAREDLTMRRFYDDLPPSTRNVVVLTVQENRRLW